MQSICEDLAAEYAALDDLVRDLGPEDWATQTPFFGWTIKDEISHLAYFDRAARLSVTDPEAFAADFERLLAGVSDYEEVFDKVNAQGRAMTDAALLDFWRTERKKLVEAFAGLSPEARVPWYGPSMSARSSATARIMETFAHGQDVADALGVFRPGTDRLRHIAHLGVSTFNWSFKNRKLPVPEQSVRVALTGPSDDLWTWGPGDAADAVIGPALDFCLVVVQRRNVADTRLMVVGETAEKWMRIAQAFAGPPADPPAPGERVVHYNIR